MYGIKWIHGRIDHKYIGEREEERSREAERGENWGGEGRRKDREGERSRGLNGVSEGRHNHHPFQYQYDASVLGGSPLMGPISFPQIIFFVSAVLYPSNICLHKISISIY
jgi:hypothetical protein